ncbi:transmembrane protein [Cystoisospora suis]|uniref:Transmembrane protein n=1 Tax=Cystoisospora suis TaxID=483139 RepID=A0A2C6L9U1_9APIC|nr:transmembrane protein [Cystoisospora suis]
MFRSGVRPDACILPTYTLFRLARVSSEFCRAVGGSELCVPDNGGSKGSEAPSVTVHGPRVPENAEVQTYGHRVMPSSSAAGMALLPSVQACCRELQPTDGTSEKGKSVIVDHRKPSTGNERNHESRAYEESGERFSPDTDGDVGPASFGDVSPLCEESAAHLSVVRRCWLPCGREYVGPIPVFLSAFLVSVHDRGVCAKPSRKSFGDFYFKPLRTVGSIVVAVFLLSILNVFCVAASSSIFFIRPLHRSPLSNPFLQSPPEIPPAGPQSLRAGGAFQRRLQEESAVFEKDSNGYSFSLHPYSASSNPTNGARSDTLKKVPVGGKGCLTIGNALHIWGGSSRSLPPDHLRTNQRGDGVDNDVGLGVREKGGSSKEETQERFEAPTDCLLRGTWWPTAQQDDTFSGHEPDHFEGSDQTVLSGDQEFDNGMPSVENIKKDGVKAHHSLLETAARVCAAVGGSSSHKAAILEQTLRESSDSDSPFLYREALAAEVGRDRWRTRITSSRVGYALLDHFCSRPSGVSSFRDAIGVYRVPRQPVLPQAPSRDDTGEVSKPSSAFTTTSPSSTATTFSTLDPSSSSAEDSSGGFAVAIRSYAGTLAAYLVPLAVGLVLLLVVLPVSVLLASGVCCCPSKGGVCWGCGGCCLSCWCLLRRTRSSSSSSSLASRPCHQRSSTGRSISQSHHGSYRLARKGNGVFPSSGGSSYPASEGGGDDCLPGSQVERLPSYTRVSTGNLISSPSQQTREPYSLASRRPEENCRDGSFVSLWVLRPSVRVFSVTMTLLLICGVATCVVFMFLFTARLHQAVDDTHCAVSAAFVQLFYGGLGPPVPDVGRPDTFNSTAGPDISLIVPSGTPATAAPEGGGQLIQTGKDVLSASSLIASSLQSVELGSRRQLQQKKVLSGVGNDVGPGELLSVNDIQHLLGSYMSRKGGHTTADGEAAVSGFSRVPSSYDKLLSDMGGRKMSVSNLPPHEHVQSGLLRDTHNGTSTPTTPSGPPAVGYDLLSSLGSAQFHNSSFGVSSSPLVHLSELANSSSPVSSFPYGVKSFLREHGISTDAVQEAAQAVVDALGDSPSSRMLVRHAAALLGLDLPFDGVGGSGKKTVGAHSRKGAKIDQSAGRPNSAPALKVTMPAEAKGMTENAKEVGTARPTLEAPVRSTFPTSPERESDGLGLAGHTARDDNARIQGGGVVSSRRGAGAPVAGVGGDVSVGFGEAQQKGLKIHLTGSGVRRLSNYNAVFPHPTVGTLTEVPSNKFNNRGQGWEEERAIEQAERQRGQKEDNKQSRNPMGQWASKALKWVWNLVSGIGSKTPGKDNNSLQAEQLLTSHASSPTEEPALPPVKNEASGSQMNTSSALDREESTGIHGASFSAQESSSYPPKEELVTQVNAPEGAGNQEKGTGVSTVVPTRRRGSDDYSPSKVQRPNRSNVVSVSGRVPNGSVSSDPVGEGSSSLKTLPNENDENREGLPKAEPSSPEPPHAPQQGSGGPSSATEKDGGSLPTDGVSTAAPSASSPKASVVSEDGNESFASANSQDEGEGTSVELPSPGAKPGLEGVASNPGSPSVQGTSERDRTILKRLVPPTKLFVLGTPDQKVPIGERPPASGEASQWVPNTETSSPGLLVGVPRVIGRQMQEEKASREDGTKKHILSSPPGSLFLTKAASNGGVGGGGQTRDGEQKPDKVESVAEPVLETEATAVKDTETMSGGFAGLKPALKIVSHIRDVTDGSSPDGLRQAVLDAAVSGLNVELPLALLAEHMENLQEMITSQTLDSVSEGSNRSSFHRSLGQLVVAPVLHVMQAQLPKLREVIRQTQENCRQTVVTIKDIERRVSEAFTKYYSVDEATEMVEEASVVVERQLARAEIYKKPVVVALYVAGGIAAMLLLFFLASMLYIFLGWRRGKSSISSCCVLLLWPLALLTAILLFTAGGAMLIASVLQTDACIFVSTEVQHPGMIEALLGVPGVSDPDKASESQGAASVAKACLGNTNEETVDRNLTSALGLTDVAESVGSFEGMLQEAVSSLDLSGIDQVLLAVSMLCKLIHDTAWVYFIDKDALQAEGLEYRLDAYPVVKYSGLQDKRRSFRSFFDIPTADLTGPPTLTRQDLITVPPRWDGNPQELFEFLKKEAARLEAQSRKLQSGSSDAVAHRGSGGSTETVLQRGTSAESTPWDSFPKSRPDSVDRGVVTLDGSSLGVGGFSGYKGNLKGPPQAGLELLDRFMKGGLSEHGSRNNDGISGNGILLGDLVRSGPRKLGDATVPGEGNGLPLQRDAAGGAFVSYGLLDVESAIAPFYFEALHKGDTHLDPKFCIDDNFSVNSPVVQKEIAKRQDPADRLMFENSLWLAGVKQRLRTGAEKRGGEDQPQSDADMQGQGGMSGTSFGLEGNSYEKERVRALPFRCSFKVPIGEAELQKAREQEAGRRKGLRLVLDSEDVADSGKLESADNAVLLPYRREWRPCSFDEWLELIEGEEAPALMTQARALYLTVHGAKAKVESFTVPAVVSALERTRLLLSNLNCTPVFRSVQTVQHLACRDAGEATVLLSVTWLILGVVAFLIFLVLFLIWHALWANRRRRRICRRRGSSLKDRTSSSSLKVASTGMSSVRSSEQESGTTVEGGSRNRAKPVGVYSECSRSSRQGSRFEDDITDTRYSSAQTLPGSVSGARDSRDRYPSASWASRNAFDDQEQWWQRPEGGGSSGGGRGSEGQRVSSHDSRRLGRQSSSCLPPLPADARAVVDDSMWAAA